MSGLTASRRARYALIAGGVALVVAVAALWIRSQSAYATPAECARRSRVDDVNACLEPYYRAMAERGAGVQAMEDLQQLSASGAFDDCHMLAHHYAHIAYQVRGDFEAVFRDGSSKCNDGYYHGVVEAAFYALATGTNELPTHHGAGQPASTALQDGPLPAEVMGLCEPFLEDARLYFECVHGIGHGLMYTYEHDVTRSLPGCAHFADPGLAEYCRDGVFMENVLRFLPLDEADFEKFAGTACDGLDLDDDDFGACYFNIGEIATIYMKHDGLKATSFCNDLDASRQAKESCTTGVSHEMAAPH